MNTSKDNLEFQIKKQINEREITPSRDLWSEIELQNSNNSPVKSKLNWYLIAACLVLTVSLGAVLFFSNDATPKYQSQIAKKNDHSVEKEKTVKLDQQENPVLSENNENQIVVKENLASKKNEEQVIPTSVVDKKVENTISQEKKEEIFPEIAKVQPTKIIASIDSAKTPAKKKRYVDPSTLLFSVEHKDVIEKTKEGSNVATIDLNIK
jgi:hypothetical protein